MSTKLLRVTCVAALAVSAIACHAVSMAPQASTSLVRHETKQSAVCSIFVFVDRGGADLSFPDSPDPDGRIFAGYSTTFRPGTPPFACDRFYQDAFQGVFRFGVYQLADEVKRGFRSARLEVQEITPVVMDAWWAEPWGIDFGSAWLGPSEPVRRDTCWFEVRAATENWAPGMPGWGQPAIATRALAAGAQRFEMPTEVLRQIYVTDEVRGWLNGREDELGFTIEPVAEGMNAKVNSTCTGLFRFRLIVGYDDELD